MDKLQVSLGLEINDCCLVRIFSFSGWSYVQGGPTLSKQLKSREKVQIKRED